MWEFQRREGGRGDEGRLVSSLVPGLRRPQAVGELQDVVREIQDEVVGRMECFRRVTNRRGARAGAEIRGKARSPGWNASLVTPDAVPTAPSPPEAGVGVPRVSGVQPKSATLPDPN